MRLKTFGKMCMPWPVGVIILSPLNNGQVPKRNQALNNFVNGRTVLDIALV